MGRFIHVSAPVAEQSTIFSGFRYASKEARFLAALGMTEVSDVSPSPPCFRVSVVKNLLLHKSLAHGVNEIRGSWGFPVGPHVAGDLAAMVGGVQNHMSQNVCQAARP